MLGKRQKLTAKRGWVSEDPTPNFDITKFVNEGPPIGLTPFVKIGPSLKKRASTTPTTSFTRPFQIRDDGRYANTSSSCDECGTRILCQPHLLCREKGPGAWSVGRIQRAIYQPIL